MPLAISSKKPETPTITPPAIDLEMQYGLANRLTQVQQSPTVLDADGNLLEAELGGKPMQFQFNSRNQLIQAGDVTYHYDAAQHLVGVNDTRYVVNPQPALSQVLVRTQGNGEVTYYVYGLGLIGESSGGNYFSYHFDFRGSTVALK